MSRFHFDESAAETVMSSFCGIMQNIRDCANALNNISMELYDYEGFNIEYAIERINKEKNVNFRVCSNTLENGYNVLNCVRERVAAYSTLSYIDKFDPFKEVDNIELQQKYAQYGHDPDRTTTGIIDAVVDGISLDISKIWHTDKKDGLQDGVDNILDGLGMLSADDELYSKIYNELLKGTFKFSSNLKKIIPVLSDDETCKTFFDIMGTISNGVELSNDVYASLAAKYFTVMKYLDTMANYYSGNDELLDIIDRCRETYTDNLKSVTRAIMDYVVDYDIKYVTKEVVKEFTKAAGIGMDKFNALGFALSNANKALGYDDLYSSYMTLDGVEEVRVATKTAYKAAIDKISSGIYTQEDINNANNLFDIYKQSLIEEYEAMISIEKYKYENKVNWLNGASWNPSYRNKALNYYNSAVSEYTTKIEAIRKIENPIGILSK